MLKESDKKHLLIPRDILPDHVIGLVESLYSLGCSADPMHIGDITGESIDVLPKAIDVAEALNLVKYENGYLRITDLGKKIAEANPKKLRKMLREAIISNKVEPLYEVYMTLKERKTLTKEEFREIIEKHYRRVNNEIMNNVLMWGTYLGLFKLSEDDTQVILLSESIT